MLQEFKKFALKGNVIDLAIGVIIGGAFGKIVTSLVNDIIMPMLGIVTGKINLTDLKWVIDSGKNGKAALTLNYGQFLQTMIDFLLVALSIFFMIKLLSTLHKKQEEPPKETKPSAEEILLTEIRDILKEKGN
ncbi:MAG: large-conductance mechanosensitive channel protein MscL [Bacillota bacterium]|nr:large-conductance mechanosensitive channel protein MscL [Bacillota bacterium]